MQRTVNLLAPPRKRKNYFLHSFHSFTISVSIFPYFHFFFFYFLCIMKKGTSFTIDFHLSCFPFHIECVCCVCLRDVGLLKFQRKIIYIPDCIYYRFNLMHWNHSVHLMLMVTRSRNDNKTTVLSYTFYFSSFFLLVGVLCLFTLQLFTLLFTNK